MTHVRSTAELCGTHQPLDHPYLLPIIVVLFVALGASFLFSQLLWMFFWIPSYAIREGWTVGEIATFFAGRFDLTRPVSALRVSQKLGDAHLSKRESRLS